MKLLSNPKGPYTGKGCWDHTDMLPSKSNCWRLRGYELNLTSLTAGP